MNCIGCREGNWPHLPECPHGDGFDWAAYWRRQAEWIMEED